MRERLLELIEQTKEIESLFHSTFIPEGIAMTPGEVIYDIQDFRVWVQELKLELQMVYDTTKNKFIWDTLNDLSVNFNGWDDRRKFNQIKGDLLAIKRNIDYYYPLESTSQKKIKEEISDMNKQPKIFISHSSKDKDYVLKLVNLLDSMGLSEEQIFCSSVPGYDIPVGKTIFDYLREQFQEYNLHVIFVLSKNYYQSPVSLNEMGAAWVLSSNNTSILLPGFEFSEMKGVVNGSSIAIKLDSNIVEVKDKLNQLYEIMIKEFSLKRKRGVLWEQKRDDFIESIENLSAATENKKLISEVAMEMLELAVRTEDAIILRIATLSGNTINIGNISYSSDLGVREFSKYEDALEELLQKNMIKALGKKGETFKVTGKGFSYIEELKSE